MDALVLSLRWPIDPPPLPATSDDSPIPELQSDAWSGAIAIRLQGADNLLRCIRVGSIYGVFVRKLDHVDLDFCDAIYG